MSTVNSPKFIEGEKVLCYHGPLIYEAKCLRTNIVNENHIRYMIHYAGWNKRWDEWVPQSRMLKYNEANLERQKKVQNAYAAQAKLTKKAPAKAPKTEVGVAPPSREKGLSPTSGKEEEVEMPVAAKATKRQSKDSPAKSVCNLPKKRSRLDRNQP